MKRIFTAALLIFLTSLTAHAYAAQWTVLVYLNGFNDLDASGYLNLNQMENVGSSKDVNIVVEWGSMKAPKSTKRLLIQHDNDPKHVTSPVIEDLGKVDMGDADTLKDFLLWGMHKFPARHYVAVVWDHGSGWHDIVMPQARDQGRMHVQDISWDDLSGNAITTEELGRVIREVAQITGRKLDIFASDACLMAMGEVAGEMSSAVDYFAGSQELEPATGWPYDTILREMVDHPQHTPAEVADLIAKSYVQLYDGNDDATFSVYDMSRFVAFETAVGELAQAIQGLDKSARSATLKLVKATQNYYDDYGDLGDFTRRLQAQGDIDDQVLADVQQALQSLVISNYMTKKYPNTRGISLWLPQDRKTFKSYAKRYSGLTFSAHTNWADAISAYLN